MGLPVSGWKRVSATSPAAGGRIVTETNEDDGISRASLDVNSVIYEVGTTAVQARERLATKLEKIAAELRR